MPLWGAINNENAWRLGVFGELSRVVFVLLYFQASFSCYEQRHGA
jgi:hypothetical protein